MRLLSISVFTLSLAGSALAAQSALDAAAAAMGGKDRVLAIRTLVLEGTGTQLNFGQNLTPAAQTQFEVTSWQRSFDYANHRWFLDLTRVPKFVTGNMAPQRSRTGLDGDVAYNIGGGVPPAPGIPAPPVRMTRVSGPGVADRPWEFVTHPVGFLQAAYAAGASVKEEPAAVNMRRVTITYAGAPVSMVVDMRTNLPARIERVVDQQLLGDVALITDWSDYQDSPGGYKLPMRAVQRYENLFTVADMKVTAARANADVGNIAATDSVRAVVVQASALAPTPPVVTVDTLAPGVWRIAGQSHHSIAIEQSNRVVLVEAPQSDARSLAAIAKAREIAPPGKPVDLVINTHHHFDHSGGLRAAMSQGMQIATHQGNKDFYERVVYPRRHTLQPDALANNPKPLRLMTIADRFVMRDSMRVIEIYHVPNPHNANMLMVYLPAEKILIQADLYNPPAATPPPNSAPPVFPFVASLVENVATRKLQVERVVGIHGSPVPWSAVEAAAAAAAAATRMP